MNVATKTETNLCWRYGAIIAGVALVAALAMIFGVFRAQSLVANTGDPYHYGEIARGFVENGFTKLTRRAASLYPEAIALVYRFGGSDLVVVLLQSLLHVGTCLLVFSLGRHLYNARTGFLAGLFCALHPMLLRYVADLQMETLLTFLCVLTVWLTVRFHERPTIVNGILLGVVGMCATLTKGVMLPVVVAFGIVSAVLAIKRHSMRGFIAVAAMFVTMAVVLAPWTYRNYQVTGGRFVLLTPGASDSFLRGYIFTRYEFATLQKPPYTDAENESNEWFRKIARDAGTEWEADEVVDEANNARVAKQLIVTQPLDTVRKIVVGLFTFWYEMTSLKNSLVPASLAIICWALAFIGLKRAHEEGRPSWLLWLPIVVMNVFVAILIPLGRYSVPILPLLMILAAFGVDTLLKRRNVGGAIRETFGAAA
ncbi:ArnT family glycosyltransferase [Hyphomicrobium sp.]|jgi:4-amino-4-deoxy-L-arabinose transferase-like glycosyltransferase|uniref:ArnT family glycosyltransferase n=1 Tax=Hyphomicrobium sp. TaxID=82 RepID=UPI00356ABE5D